MGEYARRIADRQEVKIGTCENMYYLRYEDREKVRPLPGSLDPRDSVGLLFRLPFPDEDTVPLGEYEPYNRGFELLDKGGDRFTDVSTQNEPGTVQVTHGNGLLLSVRCYHGNKLPEGSLDIKPFWNGKSHSLELSSVKSTKDGVLPIVHCRWCGMKWRYDWADVIDYLHAGAMDEQRSEMRRRLMAHCREVPVNA